VVRYGTFAIAPLDEVIAAYPKPTYVGSVGYVDDLEYVPVPAPALKLAEYAREQSWEVRAQYTCGSFPHGTTGRPGAEQHVISLRFGGHLMTDRQAYAIYSRAVAGGTWTWRSVAVWGPDLPPYLGLDVTGLRAFILTPGDADTFIVQRRVALAAADAAKKVEADTRKAIKKEFNDAVLSALTGAISPSETIAKLAMQYGRSAEEVEKIVTKRSGKEREHA
jgi:hypothetical protein